MSNKPINGYDPNYFLENQLHNVNNTWDLFGPAITKESTFSKEVDHEKPILSGIIQDNSLVISGNHEYSGANSGKVSGLIGDVVNKVKEGYNSLSDMVATDIGFFSDLTNNGDAVKKKLTEFTDSLHRSIGEQSGGKQTVANKLLNSAVSGIEKAINTAGTQMITAFDYVKVFKGTSLSYNIPSLETRLIYGVHHARHLNKKEFESERYPDVRDKLIHLNNYFIGALYSLTGLQDDFRSLDDVIGFQAPPSGYLPKFSLVKQFEELPNTFTLRYGNFIIPNLLIGSFTYNISNIRVRQGKLNKHNSAKNSTFHDMYTEMVPTPLYADINISLVPCTFISRELINSIITGEYSVGKSLFGEELKWGLRKIRGISNQAKDLIKEMQERGERTFSETEAIAKEKWDEWFPEEEKAGEEVSSDTKTNPPEPES
jgi:hypothetical protein